LVQSNPFLLDQNEISTALPTRPGGGRGGSGHKLSLNIFEEAGLELLKGKLA